MEDSRPRGLGAGWLPAAAGGAVLTRASAGSGFANKRACDFMVPPSTSLPVHVTEARSTEASTAGGGNTEGHTR